MTYIIMYGLLALATASISIAAKSKIYWKLGLIFLGNWIVTVISHSYDVGISESLIAIIIDMSSCCMIILIYLHYETYKPWICHPIHGIYVTQCCMHGYLVSVGYSPSTYAALNALFIINALLIIIPSLGLMIRRKRKGSYIVARSKHNKVRVL